jgi:enoyl-CoA hydratase/carnithine racemase
MRGAVADQLLKTIAGENEVFAERLTSPEAKEAVGAFFQKRKPDFSQFS